MVDYPYSGYFEIVAAKGSERGSGVYMGTSIQNPYRFYPRRTSDEMKDAPEYDWCEHIGFNRWDAKNYRNLTTSNAPAERATVKTIYDPCPPGWCVPPVGAFYAFTSAGGATKYSTPKTTMSSTDITPAFRVKANASEDIGIKLPITGDRSRYYGAPWWTSLASRNVQLWTATPTTVTKTISNKTYTYTTCAFYVSSGDSYYNSDGLAKSSGFAVLPVKEEE